MAPRIDLLRVSARDCRPFNLITRIEWRRRLSCSRWACVALPPLKCCAEGERVAPSKGQACKTFRFRQPRKRDEMHDDA
jgi:hypothetical protein